MLNFAKRCLLWPWRGRFFRWITCPFLLLLGLLAVFLVMLVDTKPNAISTAPSTVAETVGVRSRVTMVYNALFRGPQLSSVLFSEAELNVGLGLLHRITNERITARTAISDSGLAIVGTVTLLQRPVPLYVNVLAGVPPSDHGLEVEPVKVGSISFSGKTAVFIAKTLSDWLLGDSQGTRLVGAIQRVDFEEKTINTTIARIPKLNFARLKQVRNFLRDVRDQTELLANPTVVAIYYDFLYTIAMERQSDINVSLSEYLTPLFAFAHERSQQSDAVTENTAAIYALAVLLGTPKIEQLIGNVTVNSGSPRTVNTLNVTLAGRRDLRLHFVISAALKLVGDAGFSFAIGEVKELLDAGAHGSGFSFADLAADRAGIQLAIIATHPTQAANAQRAFAEMSSESLYFPSIAGLPEGLSEQAFRQTYSDTGSQAYRNEVAGINARIAACLLYQYSR